MGVSTRIMYTAATVLLLGLAGAVPSAAADPATTPDRSTTVDPTGVDAQQYYYELRARHSGKCLDVRGASTQNGADVIQYSCHGGTNQQWGFTSAADSSSKLPAA